MKFLFWFSFLFIAYTYVGYPLLLYVWARLFPKKVKKAYPSPEPTVSVVIAARNEERYIGSRIKNLLEQDYPLEKLKIIVISDGSKDNTNKIVRQFIKERKKGSPELTLIEVEPGKGKPHALNIGVRKAKGELIVFTDARQKFEPSAIKELVANFNDPTVGCASGELFLDQQSDNSIGKQMRLYWDMEKRIRKMESAIHSVIGATGAIYAMRKALFHPLPEGALLDDLLIPMNAVRQGYRNIYDSQAVASDTVSRTVSQERRRKIRTLLGNYQLLQINPRLLSPTSNPLFLRYISHKIFRLFIPFFFLTTLFTSYGSNGIFYTFVFAFCIALFVFSLIDRFVTSVPYLNKVCDAACTFVSLNYFAVLAFFSFIWPGKKSIW